jgi:hypothetical protein
VSRDTYTKGLAKKVSTQKGAEAPKDKNCKGGQQGGTESILLELCYKLLRR